MGAGPEDGLLAALAAVVGPSRVLARPIDLAARAGDASFYRLVPRAVVEPAREEEIAGLFAVSHRARVPLTFRAAGTSLSGQAITDGILVDLSRSFGKVEPLDRGRRVRVGPGAIGGRVNALLAPYGRRIGPDPASINACMLGGILANNASGMCCGVAENAYHTLESVRFVLPSGLVVDTADPRAGEHLSASAPELVEGLVGLRARILADPALTARIRAKYRTKNTTGYGLNAFLDFDRPEQLLAHLLVGSEGTLAFIAEAVLTTLPEYPAKRTGLLLFEDVASAAATVEGLARSGARAIELMDWPSLRSVASEPGLGVAIDELPVGTVALLVEYQCPDEPSLAALRDAEASAVAEAPVLVPPTFTSDPAARAALWKLRKGLYPAAGATKRSGETVIIEDVAFALDHLAPAITDLQRLFAEHGYADAIVFGHAKDGNIHFVLKQSFNTAVEVARYERFMGELAACVVTRHDGAMKAEHGTGRNVAPFVELEWGKEAYAIMRELKALVDPTGLLNPGVILDPDPRAHVKNLKDLPTIDPEVDRCVECGFCEPVCPSRRLTLTPRQRISVRRELARLERSGEVAERAAIARDFQYSGIDTCAADGLCATACPVKIDTGLLVKRLRADAHGPGARQLAAWLARHTSGLERALRFGLRVAHGLEALFGARTLAALSTLLARVLGTRIPAWSTAIPRVPRRTAALHLAPRELAAPEVVYVPSCLSRIMGAPRAQARSLTEVVEVLARRAGVGLRVPASLAGQCCGLPFGSKGFWAEHAVLLEALVDRMFEASDEGRLPIVLDATSCLQSVRASRGLLDSTHLARLEALHILDPSELARDVLLPRLHVSPISAPVALHPNCAARKLGLEGALRTVAERCAGRVHVPIDLGCCGTAGDRGLLFPELPRAALEAERAELLAGGSERHYSSNLTCEVGLAMATGLDWSSILYLVEEATRTRPSTAPAGASARLDAGQPADEREARSPR